MANFGSALIADRFEAQQMVKEAISSSPNLAVAMESIGAMYGIPSSHILVDNNLKNVKVMNEHIICPGNVSAANNTSTIVRSIGSILDQISARINEKLDNLQMDNIEQGRETDEVISRSDPSKGKVVATHKDANGELVLVYDSGIIDAPHTPEGRAKADEIRAAGNVPTLDPFSKKTPSYFNDEDDVTNGVNMNAGNSVATEYCISEIIGESAFYLDAMAKYGEESPLGQAILTAHGYDCVRPTMNVVQEAATSKGKKVTVKDIKYMKFDNKKIYKAIDYLNKARAEQDNVKHPEDLDMEKFVRNPNYLAAIKCLEEQFDCHIALKWVHEKKEESMAGTLILKPEYRNKLTVSKSKGFQLGGSPIWIVVIETGITELISEDPKIFGQGVVSILLHEIFHNIAGIIRYENAEFVTTLNTTVEAAIEARDPKTRRIILERYTDMLNEHFGGKLGKIGKRMMVKRLSAFIAAESDSRLMTQYNDAVSKDDEKNKESKADKLLKIKTRNYKDAIKINNRYIKGQKGWGITDIVIGCISIVGGILSLIAWGTGGAGFGVAAIGIAVGAGLTTMGGIELHEHYKIKKLYEKYNSTKQMEEYYSDLMSAMYQLPQRFFVVDKYSANDVSKDVLDEWVKVEKLAHESFLHIYPTTSERTWAGTTVAKKLLECKGLDKSVKEYLEWIVKNNDSILKTGIKEDYNSHTFDPAEAENLDAHLSSLIKNNKITTTEAAMIELVDSSEMRQWIQEGMTYSQDEKDYMDWLSISNEYDYIQEMTRTKVTGYKDETIGRRILLFIPRLLKKIVELWLRIGEIIVTGGLKLFINTTINSDKMYVVTGDMKTAIKVARDCYSLIDSIYSLTENISSFETFCQYMKDFTKNKGPIGANIQDRITKMREKNIDVKKFIFKEQIDTYDANDASKAGEKFVGHLISGRILKDDLVTIFINYDSIAHKIKRMQDQYSRIMTDERMKTLPEDVKEGAAMYCDTLSYIYRASENIFYLALSVKNYKVSKKALAKGMDDKTESNNKKGVNK